MRLEWFSTAGGRSELPATGLCGTLEDDGDDALGGGVFAVAGFPAFELGIGGIVFRWCLAAVWLRVAADPVLALELRLIFRGIEGRVPHRLDRLGVGEKVGDELVELLDEFGVLPGDVGRFADVVLQVEEAVAVGAVFALEEFADWAIQRQVRTRSGAASIKEAKFLTGCPGWAEDRRRGA